MQILPKLRYFFRFTFAFLLRFRVVIIAGAVLGILVFLLSNVILPRFFPYNDKRIGVTGRFTPNALPNFILQDVSEGLTKIGEDRVVVPALAKKWETTDKGKTWIFHLDTSRTWQDGVKITSKDINYQFSDVEIEKPNAETIVFKLKDPFSPFPSVVSRPTFRTGFLGTGGWRVSDVSLAGTYVQNVTIEKSDEGRKIFRFYPTEERTKLAYKLGYVDQISDIIDPAPLDKWESAEVSKEVKRNQVVTLFFNNEDELFKDNKTLRQALNYAIDKGALSGERAISSITPTSWVYNPQVKPYNYDESRAKELIGEETVKKGLEIKLVTSPSLLDVSEKVAKDWEKVGVHAIVQISSVIPTDYQVYLAILDVPKDPDQYSIWHSTQKDSTNVSKFANHRIDKLLEDGRVETGQEERRNIYLDFQRFLAEEVPAIFLYHPVTYTITRK